MCVYTHFCTELAEKPRCRSPHDEDDSFVCCIRLAYISHLFFILPQLSLGINLSIYFLCVRLLFLWLCWCCCSMMVLYSLNLLYSFATENRTQTRTHAKRYREIYRSIARKTCRQTKQKFKRKRKDEIHCDYIMGSDVRRR